MKKEITKTGINGTFSGYVEIIFGHRTEVKEVHNRSNHDEEQRIFTYGIIRGRADTLKMDDVEFLDTSTSLGLAEAMEFKISMHLERLTDSQKRKTVQEELSERGYKM